MTRALIALGLAIGVVAGLLAWTVPDPPGTERNGVTYTLLPLVGLAVLAAALSGLRRDGPTRPGAGSVRLLVYLALGAVVLQVVRFSPFVPATFFLLLHGALAVGALLLLVRRRAGPPPAWLRLGDAAVGLVLLTLVGAEVGLRVVAAFAPSPMFAARDMLPADRIACFRETPGTVVDGSTVGPHGFVGNPLERPADGRLVALLSDRTLGGGLPATASPATFAAQAGAGTAFAAFALDGLSTPEYRELLVTGVLELEPDAVIVVLDLGDDLVELERFEGPWRPLALWLDRANIRIALAASHLIDEPSHDPRATERTRRRTAAALSAHLGDRAPRTVERAIDDLAGMARLCAEHGVPFGAALLPARYQIDGDLWDEVRGDSTDAMREAPIPELQRRLSARAIPCLDLTPTLRAARPSADTRQGIFQAAGAQLDARGSRIVGETLAAFADRLIERGAPR